MTLLEHRAINARNIRRNKYPVSTHVPNAETIEAMEELKHGGCAGSLNMSSFAAFMESVNAID